MTNPEQAPPQSIEEFEHINDVEVDPSAERLSRGIKVVVGGPPHSGKSVFINALSENLQHDVHYLSACPDGEGMWLQRHYDDPDVKALRRKGSFTDEFVDWAAEGVKNWDGPLMVVDIGGITSPENSKIVEGATHGIILAGNLGKAAEWQDFFRESGIEEVATLHSHYHGTSDVQIDSDRDRVVGSVHYLERGVDVADRATIEAVASKIDQLVDNNEAYKAAHSEIEPQHYDMVDINELAYAVGAAETLKTRPDGTEVVDLEVGPSQLEAVYQVLTGTPLQKEVWVDGPSRSHLITTIFTALHEAGVETMKYNSPNGFIDIVPLDQEGSGSENVEWEVVENGEVNGGPSYYIEAKLDPSIPFKPEEMASVKIPEMPGNATVVISGKIPHWLRASIALGYKDKTAAVAAFIPGDGAFIAWSADKQNMPLGTNLDNLMNSKDVIDAGEYLQQGLDNLKATSRTASGQIDTSASETKADSMEDVTGQQAAELAVSNFTEAIQFAFLQKEREFSYPEQTREFVESIAKIVNGGILKESRLIRSGADSQKYPYTKVADLELAMDRFYEEFTQKLSNPEQDAVELAAWAEYNIDLTHHFFADGCGKTAKIISAFALMRANKPLPNYISREDYYANAPTEVTGQNPSIDKEQYNKWLDYYRTLL